MTTSYINPPPTAETREPGMPIAKTEAAYLPALPLDPPPCRRLSADAFDPSLSNELENALINHIVLNVPWDTNPSAEDRQDSDEERLASKTRLPPKMKRGPL